jgi:hypothetical protein
MKVLRVPPDLVGSRGPVPSNPDVLHWSQQRRPGPCAPRYGGLHMRKIILMSQVSLDGFFEGLGSDISWHLVDDELHQHMNDECRAMGGSWMGGSPTS